MTLKCTALKVKSVFFFYHDVTKILGIQSVELFSTLPFSLTIILFSLHLTDLKRPQISFKGKVTIRIPIVSFACICFDNICLFRLA